ncbi:uncharacterized protein N7496_000518 [Penicillium cataractarum]|uniref:F-box domain-containing protein n=1 Tax=Penicillium cataractarum TaxID=2100454 RepID=A0A9X0B628_9EURO|nr:uncharacterized protein N7496_000518 [Penicillium cataractarum]KAJ5389450.1 hypothetical protein N7496_000518 [Penicillium cataractarum]
MAFQTLATELIFIIAHLLNQADLNALIQTCRLFYIVLNDTLYVNNVNRNHGSALFWAASKGNIGTIRRMMSHGAKVRTKAESPTFIRQSLTSLQPWNRQANRSPRTTRQSNLVMNFSTCGETPLHRAAERNQEAVVTYLLDHGGDMMTIDTYGYFPIQLAAHGGHASIVNIFLERGFEPNTLSWATVDASVLHSAICGGHTNIVKLLLEHGANASLKKSPGYIHPSPFELAISAYSWQRNPKLLNLEASLGKTNVLRGQEDCAMLLIERVTQIETLDESRYVLDAARLNFVKVVKALVELGADPNLRVNGYTALRFAKNARSQELIDFLEPLTSPNGKSKRKKRNV